MKVKSFKIILLLFAHHLTGCTQVENKVKTFEKNDMEIFEINKTDEEWKEVLTPEAYKVLRQKGTEQAFTGKFNEHKAPGVYSCAACNNKLFHSKYKYNSGSGWPSFYDVLDQGNVKLYKDKSFGMIRVEVVCGKCGGHLGHVFDDGPKPTGLRYCVNSVSINFTPESEQ